MQEFKMESGVTDSIYNRLLSANWAGLQQLHLRPFIVQWPEITISQINICIKPRHAGSGQKQTKTGLGLRE